MAEQRASINSKLRAAREHRAVRMDEVLSANSVL
jgi:hypothetical protein